MEYLIEFILELVIEGSIEMLPNKKIPRWVRYPLAFIVCLFCLIIIIGIIALGILLLQESIFGGIFVIICGVILLICGIVKFIKVKKQMSN